MKCCSTCAAISDQFDHRRAERDRARYRKRGPDSPTRLVLEQVRCGTVTGRTLLDVGGGIGVIGLELQAEGIRQVSLVEAAPSYLAVAEKEFARTQGAAEFSAYLGDFVDVPAALAADVVTLDRVVCCYPDYQRLLRRAAESTRNILVLSFPRDRWFVRLGVGVENLLRWIRRRNFRTFVHPAAEIASTLGHSGLQRKARRNTLTWCVERWTRPRPE